MMEQKINKDFEVDWEKLREEFSPDVILREEVIAINGRKCVKVLMESLGEVFCELEEREDAGDFHHWNFRVIKDGDEYKICEVHYRENGEPTAWADTSSSNLTWTDPSDLLGTYRYIGHAFEKPILEVVEGEKLREIEGSTLVNKPKLEELISKITPENRHEEI